jgi:hypothetical protein
MYVVDKHGKRGRREGSQKREGKAEVKEREKYFRVLHRNDKELSTFSTVRKNIISKII